jgi:hypothetical protein
VEGTDARRHPRQPTVTRAAGRKGGLASLGRCPQGRVLARSCSGCLQTWIRVVVPLPAGGRLARGAAPRAALSRDWTTPGGTRQPPRRFGSAGGEDLEHYGVLPSRCRLANERPVNWPREWRRVISRADTKGGHDTGTRAIRTAGVGLGDGSRPGIRGVAATGCGRSARPTAPRAAPPPGSPQSNPTRRRQRRSADRHRQGSPGRPTPRRSLTRSHIPATSVLASEPHLPISRPSSCTWVGGQRAIAAGNRCSEGAVRST